jgi:hypothetical protein
LGLWQADSVAETDELWGSTLTSVTFDPVAWRLRFAVEALQGEEHRRYELTLDGVTQWNSSRDIPLPWNHAELTEIHVSSATNHLVVEMLLWSENASLTVHCARAGLDRLQ